MEEDSAKKITVLSQKDHDLTILVLHEILGEMRQINLRYVSEQAEALARLEAIIEGLRKELDDTTNGR